MIKAIARLLLLGVGIGFGIIAMVLTYTLGYSSSLVSNETPGTSVAPVKENISNQTQNFENFKELNLAKDTIKVKYENNTLNLTLPIYYETNRYYLPATEILTRLEGKQIISPNILQLQFGDITQTINLQTNTYTLADKSYPLVGKVFLSGDVVYLSLFDLHKLFNLKIDWNVPEKTLSLYKNREVITRQPEPQNINTSPALIRLEDFSATPFYSLPDSLEKLRIVSDYLFSQNIPFHVAWVPRYIDPRPSSKADVDISQQYSMNNADIVYTLDYMHDEGALIGLHGYTHQYGTTESIDGFEFHTPYAGGTNIPATDEYAIERVNLAKEAAARLKIPIAFFEAPHYAAYGNQLKVIEKNFDIIYEYYPGFPYQITSRKNGDRNIKYIPTPLDYLDGKKDLNRMLSKIQNIKPNTIASFYYHPYIEFESIILNKTVDGYPTSAYLTNSPLHQILKAIQDKGYRFIKITEVN